MSCIVDLLIWFIILIVQLFECILNKINNCSGTSCKTFLFLNSSIRFSNSFG